MQTQLEKEKTENIVPKTRVLFVCTGNTCRSPMAAAVLNAVAPDRYIASSAGLSCSNGKAMSENSRLALKAAGYDVPEHSSRLLTREIVAENDITVGISSAHFMVMLQAFPEFAGRFETMPHDISDPYGHDLDTYKKCLKEIEECIKERFL